MKTDENGVRFGVRFLSRSFCFSLSSAHCLVFGLVCNWHLTLHLIIRSVCQDVKTALIFSGLLVFRRKKNKMLWDFQGQIRGKISRFYRKCQRQGFWYFAEKKAKFRGIFRGKFAEKSADFAGKKSKFAEQSADFRRFSQEKSQNSQENRPISRDFSGKESIFEGFSGANNFLRIS